MQNDRLNNDMVDSVKESLWKQFGASIDMLTNAVRLWPDACWDADKKFFYIAYHCAVFLDYYLTIPPNKFSPQLPFTLTAAANIPQDAIDDVVPDRIYSKTALLDYLASTREKCRRFIADLTAAQLRERWIDEPENSYLDLAASSVLNYSVLDILLFNMRHVQHHAAQLNLLLRQKINNAPDWVSQAL